MHSKESLAARVAVLENAVVVLVARLAEQEQHSTESVLRFYQALFGLSVKRYTEAQPGPEKTVAEGGLNWTHRLFDRLSAYVSPNEH